MNNKYLEYNFSVFPVQSGNEILIAELGHAGFEGFLETKTGLKAYIQEYEWNDTILTDIQILSSDEFEISYTIKEIEQVNWNEAWEKNFPPIIVDEKCMVRAPFHPKSNMPYEIIIEPKMSFGTGHHETTFMMLQYILENDFTGKSVLDMGCGTAVLSILSEMRNALKIDAIDIDTWCYENSKENIERNHCSAISVFKGDATLLKNKKYDVIIANINRNILLQDMADYCKSLQQGGRLILSGFYTEDLLLIIETCRRLRLTYVNNKEKNNWVAAKFEN